MSRSTKDFAISSRRAGQGARLPSALIVGLVIIGMAAGSYGSVKQRYLAVMETRSLMKVWKLQGKPCPSISSATFRKLAPMTPKGVEIDEVVFRRRMGEASCLWLTPNALPIGDYPVCQFSDPEVLTVTTPKSEWFFLTGIGRRATVSMQNGVARCVLASGPGRNNRSFP